MTKEKSTLELVTNELKTFFKFTVPDNTGCFIGMEIKHNFEKGINFYLSAKLHQTNREMFWFRKCFIPSDPNTKLSMTEGTNNDTVPYREAVGIIYNGTSELIGCSDSDFANDVDTRKSTSGYIFKLSNAPISWSNQRQQTTSLSTTEAEYVAAANATKEAVWLRQFRNMFQPKIS